MLVCLTQKKHTSNFSRFSEKKPNIPEKKHTTKISRFFKKCYEISRNKTNTPEILQKKHTRKFPRFLMKKLHKANLCILHNRVTIIIDDLNSSNTCCIKQLTYIFNTNNFSINSRYHITNGEVFSYKNPPKNFRDF